MAEYNDETDLGKTITRLPKADTGPAQSRLLTVPLLTPVAGSVSKTVRVTRTEFVIGRQAGVDLQLRDTSVSRRHARILYHDEEYILEDMQSSHGTFVDNVPVVRCVLRDGDILQFGKNVFYFDRLLEWHDPHAERRS